MDFDTWYGREFDGVARAMAVAASDVHLGEQVAAEAFARAFARWARVSRMESPGGWVYRTALNLLRRDHRRSSLERRLLPAIARSEPTPGLPLDEVLDVGRAVSRLPARQREAVGLYYGAGLSQVEVAEAMAVTTGTVAATLHAARGRLSEFLSDEPSDEVVS